MPNDSSKTTSAPGTIHLLHGIQTRLTLAYSALFAGTLMFLGLIHLYGAPFTPYRGMLETYKREAIRGMNLAADLKEDRLRLWLDERLRDLEVLSVSRSERVAAWSLSQAVEQWCNQGVRREQLRTLARELSDYQAVMDDLNDARRICAAYQRVFVVDAATGLTIVSTEQGDVGNDNRQEAYFRKAIELGGKYVSDAQIDRQGDHPILYFSCPLNAASGKPVAVVVFEANADDLIQPILRAGEALGERGEALLVTRDARNLCRLKYPLADGFRPKPLERVIAERAAALAATGHSGVIEALDYRGTPVVAAYRSVSVTPDVRWGLVVKRDQAELYEELYSEVRYDFYVGLLSVLLVVGATIVLASGLTRPIRVLSRTADAIARGDWGARASVNTTDEVGMLATQFNSMVDQLHSAQSAQVRQERLAAIGQLTAGVAHELRNPLGTIRLAFSLVARRLHGTAHGLERPLETIERSISRCDSIIAELLDYSRCRPLDLTTLDIDSWLEGVLAELDNVPGIEIRRDLAARTTVFADGERLRRCLANLVVNGCQAMQSGGILTVSTRRTDDALRIQVSDSGCGIPEDQIARVFEPLFSTKTFGVGMGLSIVKQIVEQHGGQIILESAVGGGTTFTVLLPTPQPGGEGSLD